MEAKIIVSYEKIIAAALADGGLLDALLSLQKAEGYVSEAGLSALAKHVGVSPAELYDAASFYSMLRFEKPAQVEIKVCRGTACHSGGKLGESNERYSLGWVECLGQCQAAPNVLINGELYTNVDVNKIPELLGGAK